MLQWLDTLGYIITAWVVVWACLKAFDADVQVGFLRVWLQLISYYVRFYMLWLIIWLAVQLYFAPQKFEWLLLVMAMFYFYMSSLEPNLLRVKRQTIELSSPHFPLTQPLKLAIISDLHIGLFWGSRYQLRQLIRHLNRLEADAVIITGDWLYHAGADILGKLHLFKALNKPCYTVFSEQDALYESRYGRYSTNKPLTHQPDKLSEVLSVLGIQRLDNKNISIGEVNLIGVGAKNTLPFAQLLKFENPTIIVTHDIKQIEANPNDLATTAAKKLIVAGQTHGGQVNIPFLTHKMIKAIIGTQSKSGLTHRQPTRRLSYQVWTSTGVGMTGLPFRFNCRPCIDLLTVV